MALFRLSLCVALTALACCASSPQTPVAGAEATDESTNKTAPAVLYERILESGGELDGMPRATLVFKGNEVWAFAASEVPVGSRLQAAYAMVSAAARAELFKAIEVGVGSLELEKQDSAGGFDMRHVHVETVNAVLPGLSPPKLGWQKVQRGDEVVLRVLAQVRAPREVLLQALLKGLAHLPDPGAKAAHIVNSLEGNQIVVADPR